MKYWLRYLPLEVWVEVFSFPWISRRKLARIVDRIGNHKFAEYLQFYLHDWGKHKLKPIHFYQRPFMAIPQTPMPKNIKSFDRISISHFDAHTLAFLHQIRPILSGVHLEHYSPSNNMANLRIILASLLPLLNGIHSLSFEVRALPTMGQCIGTEQLAQIKVLSIFDYKYAGMDEAAVQAATVNFLLNWLTLPGQGNNGPRLCKADLTNELFERIAPAIREEFLVAKTPRTFALISILDEDSASAWLQLAEFHLANSKELHCVQKGHGFVQVTRHRANCSTDLQEWIEKEIAEKRHGHIWICCPTIGRNVPNNEEDDQRKPFSFCSLI